MRNPIYFPNFEPRSEIWLKFSLLYMDKFQPIVPNNREDDISEHYKRVKNGSDLLDYYSPSYEDGNKASVEAILDLEKYLSELRKGKLKKLRKENKWNYKLYKEKFNDDFFNFCIREGLAEEIKNEGLLLNEEIGHIFMKNLAIEISKNSNTSIITDSKKFKKVVNSSQNSEDDIHSIAKSVLRMKLPRNINEIPLERIIDFRIQYKPLLISFISQLELLESNIENLTKEGFLKELDDIYKRMISQIAILSEDLVSLPLSIQSIINGDASFLENLESALDIMEGIKKVGVIKSIVKDTNSKRNCVKYFTKLNKLN